MRKEDEKKAEVIGKADNNKEQPTKEQRKNKKKMILNKDENIENTKSAGEANNNMQNVG